MPTHGGYTWSYRDTRHAQHDAQAFGILHVGGVEDAGVHRPVDEAHIHHLALETHAQPQQ